MFPELVAERKKLQAKVKAHEEYMSKAKVGDKYDPPNSELKITSTVFGEKVREQVAEIEDIRKKVDELADLHQAEERVKRAKDIGEDPGGGLHEDDSRPNKAEFKTLGQRFVESAAFKEFRVGQAVGPLAKLDLSQKELKTLFRTTVDTNTNPDTPAGWVPETTRTDIVTMAPVRPGRQVLEKIPQIPTTQTAIKYMEEAVFGGMYSLTDPDSDTDRTANPRVEEPATQWPAGRAEGAAFPETRLQLIERTQPVVKQAVWLPVTDEQLEDVEQVAAYIDQRMRLMLHQFVDRQILHGDGTESRTCSARLACPARRIWRRAATRSPMRCTSCGARS